MGNVFVAADKRVKVVGKQTWLEAIHRANIAGRRIMPNSFYNEVFLGKDADGRFKPILEEILNARPFYSGTVWVIGNKGRPLGTSVETPCEYAGTMKNVIVRLGKEDAGLVDTILASDHLFGLDGKPLLPLSNAKTGKPIRNDDEMGEANEVLLTLNGQTRRYVLKSREGGVLEAVGNERTRGWISDTAHIGLMRRGNYFYSYWCYVYLGVYPSERFAVIREAGTPATVETGSPKLKTEIIDDGVILRGSGEQVQALLRLGRSNSLL